MYSPLCIETTKLYGGNTLISETSNFFENDCPGDDAGDDRSSIRSIEHTIQDGPPSPSVHTRSIGPKMKEDPYRIVDTSEDEHYILWKCLKLAMMMAMTTMVIIKHIKPVDGVSMNPNGSAVHAT